MLLDQGPGVRNRLRGHPIGTFACERLAELQPAFEAVAAEWSRFASAEPDLHRSLIDATAEAGTKLGMIGVPTTLLLDRDGREVARYTGQAEWDRPEVIG